jgi:4a-hydroxytetrahydrobiopterin dehydratase
MAERGRGLLDDDALTEQLKKLTGWTFEDGKLVKSYRFADFVSAVAFVDRLTPIAEAQNHHPDLVVAWGRVTVQLWSHDSGGVTARDVRLATALDEL